MGWGKEKAWIPGTGETWGPEWGRGWPAGSLPEFLVAFGRWRELDACLHGGDRACGGKAGAGLEIGLLLIIPRDHKLCK